MDNGLFQKTQDFYTERSEENTEQDFPLSSQVIDLHNMYLGLIRWHWHLELEIDYVLSGSAYFTCGDKNYQLQAGDAIFINQNMKHFITPATDEPCIFYNMLFQPTYLFGFGLLKATEEYIYPIVHNNDLFCIPFFQEDAKNKEILKCIKDIKALNESESFGYELDVKAKMISLWSELYKNNVSQAETKAVIATGNQDEYRIKQALLFIQDRFSDPITLDDIANSILVSKSECCRCFKRCLQVTPFEYLMHYRITESTKQMHYNLGESISDIASSVGFNNTSYFNKIFKKYMNCTPTEYRKNLKKHTK